MNTKQPCACNVVTYRTEEDAHGHIVRGWWACTECGKEFVSKPVQNIPIEDRAGNYLGPAPEMLTFHQQHMADIDKGIKAAEAGITRHMEQRMAKRPGDCIFGCPKGMHTNGGCKCLRQLDDDAEKRIRIADSIRAIVKERDSLKAILDRCHNEMVLDGFGEGHGETDEDNAYQVRLRTDLAQAIGREF
jgi:hypothetical protein